MIHPAVRELAQQLAHERAFQEAVRRLAGPGRPSLSITGLTASAKALWLALLWQATERPLVVVTPGDREAEALAEALAVFFGILAGTNRPQPLLLPALDVLPHQHLSPHAEISERRAVGLWRLASEKVPIVITPAASALMRMEAPGYYRQLAVSIAVDEELPFDDLIDHIAQVGYERREPVEMVGEYSVRGGILDIFSPETERPVRIEFFGDLVESIRQFDVETQRSVLKLNRFSILPLAEYQATPGLVSRILDAAGLPEDAWRHGPPAGWEFLVPLGRPREHSLFDLAERAVVVWDEPERLEAAAEKLWERLEAEAGGALCPPEAHFLTWEDFRTRAAAAPSVAVRELGLAAPAAPDTVAFEVPSRPALSFQGNMRVAVGETKALLEQGYRLLFFAASNGELERLADILREYSIPYQVAATASEGTPEYLAERAYMAGPVLATFLARGNLRRGFVLPGHRLAVFGYEDLFEHGLAGQGREARSHLAAFTSDLSDLSPGDYVVHAEHGVGRFLGIAEFTQPGQQGDYMQIEYAGGGKLYVPLTRMDLVQKFRGAGDTKPPLDRMGGVTWTRTRSRIKAKLRDMAEELLKLYAQRRLVEGHAFSADSAWQREFDQSFEFEETADQLAAIRDIKRDMESPQPMDRLLCGDVGFGKTEVAMRAAFKALGDGKQVAVLAPTTVLCFQHYETFRRRFAPFPIRVEMLSRFRNPKEIKQILEELAAGKLDIVAGTHRLLSEDVEFSDLGLLIVDEEQRFGVRHKERLKQLRQNVDVLTMTATPIPRTLHMGLAGLRDMSIIQTAPKDRLAIHTVVAEEAPELIRAAIEQELGRGGQVYYIHNRIESIWETAAKVQQLVPDCRIGVGHGQMSEAALEKVTLGFMQHEFDVFVSTTIVENGLDIPLANTMIIEDAHLYGLAQLYQLRGRVGRSDRRAYAYLLVPKDVELTEVARKRLAALKEFSDLGAGFRIAALDLELRGSGNILGAEQHGHINAIGFDMYVRMLEETIRELKGEELPPEVHTRFSLGLDLRIPVSYIADEHQRLRAYKRIAEIKDQGAAEDILAELADRYGPWPGEVRGLVDFSLLKAAALELGIEGVERRAGSLQVKFHPQSRVDPQRLMGLVAATAGAQFSPTGILSLPLANPGSAEVLEQMKRYLERLRG